MKKIWILAGIAVFAIIVIASIFMMHKPYDTANFSNQTLQERQEQVTGIVSSSLEGLNDPDDYAKFSRDFSAVMKSAIPQIKFYELRKQIINASGNYKSLEFLASKDIQADYDTYLFTGIFTKENVIVTASFLSGDNKIEGIFFSSPNLIASGLK